MPRGIETCAAAYSRLRSMPQLLHLPCSAIRRAAAANTWPLIAYAPIYEDEDKRYSTDSKIEWDDSQNVYSSRYLIKVHGVSFAVTCRMRIAQRNSPEPEWNLCCVCGAPVKPMPNMPWITGFMMAPETHHEQSKRGPYGHRVKLVSRSHALTSERWYVADLLSRPIVRELRICKPCKDANKKDIPGDGDEHVAFERAKNEASAALSKLNALIRARKKEKLA